ASISRRSAPLDSSSLPFSRLRSWMRSESFSREASVRMSVPLAVLKLVKKMSPARAKTPTVRMRTGRKRRLRAGLDSVPGESAELLNVPLSPSAPRKHYANGRLGERLSPLVRCPEPDQNPARPRSASTGETLVPKSRIRKKADYTPPPAKQTTSINLTNSAWVAPVMLALFL